MVAAGDLFSGGAELADKLDEYTRQGGTLIVTAQNAARFWPEWEVGRKVKRIRAGSTVAWGDSLIVEPNAFELYDARLPRHAQIVATVGGRPLLAIVPQGKGRIILSLTPYGLNSDAVAYNNPPTWHQQGFNQYLGRPFTLLSHVKSLLHEVFSAATLFHVGEGLGYVVNHLDASKYRIAVYNNTMRSLPFKIVSHIGDIVSVEELSTGHKLFDALGYAPHGTQVNLHDKDDENHIFGGDIRLFDVTVSSPDVAVAPQLPQPPTVRNILWIHDDIMYLKETIRTMPTFFDHFSGVAVNALRLMDADDNALKRQNAWFELQSLQIAADLREGFSCGRWSLNPHDDSYPRTLQELPLIAHKLELLYGDDALFVPAGVDSLIPDALRRLNIKAVESTAHTGLYQAAHYKLCQSDTHSWDDIYATLKGCGTQPAAFRKKTPLADILCVFSQNRQHILSLDRYTTDIYAEIARIPLFYLAFGGVCIPAEYLASKSIEALQCERQRWEADGLRIVVSFIDEINHFPGLTLCDAVPYYYDLSMQYYKDVLDKMGQLGIHTALFTTQAPVEAGCPEPEVRRQMVNTFSELAQYAQPKGVELLLANTRFRVAATMPEQSELMTQMGQPNMGLAMNLNHLTTDEALSLIDKHGPALKAVILGTPGAGHHAEYLPLSHRSFPTDKLNSLNALLIVKLHPLNNDALRSECKHMKWIK